MFEVCDKLEEVEISRYVDHLCNYDPVPSREETRSICLENRFSHNLMGRNQEVSFLPIRSDSQSPTPVVHSQSISNSSVIRFVTQPSGETPSVSHSKQLVSGGMKSFRSNLISRGISIDAASLIKKSRREGTRASNKLIHLMQLSE